MPVVGFDCPFKGKVSFEFCLADAATHKQPCQFTYPILRGMVANESKLRSGIHVTSLLNCLRKVVLDQRHEIHISPEQTYWAFRGQLAHSIVELAQTEGAVVERQFAREIDGITIVGTPDVIYPDRGLLVDYKTTAQTPRYGPYPHHSLQVNIYRWLVWPEYRINRFEVVYMDMKGTVRRRPRVMSLERVEKIILPRARALSQGLGRGRATVSRGPGGTVAVLGLLQFQQSQRLLGTRRTAGEKEVQRKKEEGGRRCPEKSTSLTNAPLPS